MKEKENGKLPLDGFRVIDQTIVWAGPYATMLLADMGAEVIRVESTNFFPYVTRGHYCRPSDSILMSAGLLLGGYPSRKAGDRPWNRNPFFNLTARNKLSMTAKLNTPKGKEIFKRLVKISDCIIENYGYGAMERLGLGYDVLKEVNPRIIYVAMSAFGSRGKWKSRLALGRHLEHIAGHTLLRKYPDIEPDRLSDIYHCDATGGAIGAFAALIGLYNRMKTGKGQFIDVSLIETIIPQLGEALMDYVMNGRIRQSLGNRHEWASPCGVYRCAGEDRWVAITVFNDEEWRGLCRAMGNPEWTTEERFSSQIKRWKNQDELEKFIESWTRDKEDYEVMYLLQKEGVPSSPVMDEIQYFNDPHLKERGFFEEVTHADCGTHLYPGVPWKMSKTPSSIRKPPCRLGEHNEYVYKKLLGFTDNEYNELVKDGHIGMDYDESITVRGPAKR
jgi:crotonobetainyl-CoA:carnitine CoA-transferase CaiB-like acyl-CoA transferase